ncbi:MAG: hypothetical protein ORN27_11350 [Rhodoluna sp.]|nr:hypothetical protein [Rhodoluna sp.]
MRLLIAIGLFMLSLVLMLLGVAERTVWAPPPSYNLAVNFEAGNPYVVIPNSTLALHSGDPKVSISGPRNVFIAAARESDISAWVGDSPHTTITANKAKTKLAPTSIQGAGPALSPVGSDLWRSTRNAERAVSLNVSPAHGGGALIASDGVAPAPSSISLVWPIEFELLPSNLLLGFGFGTLVLALILNMLIYRDMRKRRGPSRRVPKAPQGPRMRPGKQPKLAPPRGRRAARKIAFALPASALILAMVTGCAPSAQTPTATPTPTAAPADPSVVQEAQLLRILKQIELVAQDGDAKSNATALISRFAGPALEQRTAWYTLRKLDAKLKALPKIAGSPVTFILPAASSIWPRTIMAITDEAGAPSPQMLVLIQASPRAQYQVWYNVRLMQGATIPAVPVQSIGAIPVATDAKFLKVVPNELPKVYGGIIDNGAGSLGASDFTLTNDEFFKQISESQDSQVAALKNGKITFSHTLGSPNVASLATSDGGALVAVTMIDGYTIRPTKKGSAITVNGLERTLLGASGSATGIISRYSDMLLFYVPKTGSEDLVRLLGVTQGLLSVRGR